MPRNSSGVYTVPAGTQAVSGDPIDSTVYNAFLTDLSAEVTNSLDRNGRSAMSADLPMGSNKITGLADPTSAQHGATKNYVDSYVPTGVIFPYCGASAPSGWFLCYGQAVSRTTYSALYALIGTTFGSGDGTTTFNVPDLRGRFIAGADAMGGSHASRLTSTYFGSVADLGATGGSESHTLTTAEMPSHGHNVIDPGHSHSARLANTGSPGGTTNEPQSYTGTPPNFTTSTSTTGITIQNNGGGNAHAIVPPSIVLNYIIRY